MVLPLSVSIKVVVPLDFTLYGCFKVRSYLGQ